MTTVSASVRAGIARMSGDSLKVAREHLARITSRDPEADCEDRAMLAAVEHEIELRTREP